MEIDLKLLYDALKMAGFKPNEVVQFNIDPRLNPTVVCKALKEAGFKPNKVAKYIVNYAPQPEKRDKHKPKQGGNK